MAAGSDAALRHLGGICRHSSDAPAGFTWQPRRLWRSRRVSLAHSIADAVAPLEVGVSNAALLRTGLQVQERQQALALRAVASVHHALDAGLKTSPLCVRGPHAAPATHGADIDVEQVQHPPNRVVDDVLHRLRI